ncbi:MAG: ImmA/IrrE family metallo-endopeptidase, partial [Nitrospirota bacterium]|nr:ImmA/IrrE family metallo-endopeptidase [Nitrospirota bacterium]
EDVARRSLDELFIVARQYKSGREYRELLEFVARFRFYSPFNAMLIHFQMPGARYVATPKRWLHNYSRRIKTGSRPLVLLQPMGPVMFAFDVSDTEPIAGSEKPLPREVENPFEVRGGRLNGELTLTIENAKRDGVAVMQRDAGSQSAGAIRRAGSRSTLQVMVKRRPVPEHAYIPFRYEVLVNSRHSDEAQYATLAHELAHLYCGHLGTPDTRWWPDRRGLPSAIHEFEAESVCFLVCSRLGIENPSAEYLSRYINGNDEIPPISFECVMKAAGLIEQMGRERLPLRKEKAK